MGTELHKFRDYHRSAQNVDNEIIKYLSFRKPFLVKYNCKRFLS